MKQDGSVEWLREQSDLKIIFNANNVLADQNTEIYIKKAIEFEILWLKYRGFINGQIFKEDENIPKPKKSYNLENLEKNIEKTIKNIKKSA